MSSISFPFILLPPAVLLAGCLAGSPERGSPSKSTSTALRCDGHLPDPAYTPGKLCTTDDPDFDGIRYPEGVAHCSRNVSSSLKDLVAGYYGVASTDYSNYQFDHYLSLGIGGANGETNLWPQPLDEARDKDLLENSAYQQLSKGEITQAEAVRQLRDWRPPGGVPAGCDSGGGDAGPPPDTGPATCSHDICTEGVALKASCDPCVAQICDPAADPFCCSTRWNYICVDEVNTICGKTCP